MNITAIKYEEKHINRLRLPRKEKRILHRMIREDKDESKLEKLAYEMIDDDLDYKPELYETVRCEVFRLMCTKTKDYAEERARISSSIDTLVPSIAATVAGTIGIAVGLISGLVAALILAILLVGRNAWCKHHKRNCGCK